MKEGEEPLRSFSDLLQFYEAQRTGQGADANVKSKAPAADSVSPASEQVADLDLASQQATVQPAVQIKEVAPEVTSDADNEATSSSE
jgi:hypothetical protein